MLRELQEKIDALQSELDTLKVSHRKTSFHLSLPFLPLSVCLSLFSSSISHILSSIASSSSPFLVAAIFQQGAVTSIDLSPFATREELEVGLQEQNQMAQQSSDTLTGKMESMEADLTKLSEQIEELQVR